MTYYERLYASLPNTNVLIPYALSMMMGDVKLSFVQTANLALIHSQYGWLKGGLTVDTAKFVYGNPIVNLVECGVTSPDLITTDQLRASSSLYNAISPHPLKELVAPLWFGSTDASEDVRAVLRCLNSSTMLTHPEVVMSVTGAFLPMSIPTALVDSLQLIGKDDLAKRMRQIGYPSIDVATPLPLQINQDITWNVDHTDVKSGKFIGSLQSIVATEFDIKGVFCPCTGKFVYDQTAVYYVNRYAPQADQNWCFMRDVTRLESVLRELCYLVAQVSTEESSIPLWLMPIMDTFFFSTKSNHVAVRLVKTYLEEYYIEFIDPETGTPVVATYLDMAWLSLFGSAISFG